MRPAKTKIKKFKMEPKYVHHRSEGLTRRQNGGTRLLVIDEGKPERKSARRTKRRQRWQPGEQDDEPLPSNDPT